MLNVKENINLYKYFGTALFYSITFYCNSLFYGCVVCYNNNHHHLLSLKTLFTYMFNLMFAYIMLLNSN